MSVDFEKLREAAGVLRGKPFRPHRLFRNGHAQTLVGYLMPRRRKLQRVLQTDEARLFTVEPNVRLLAHCRWQPGDRRARPTIILVHGLEGSSNSIYILGTAAKAFQAGFNVLRINLRTCGDTEHLAASPYNAGTSADLRVVINELIERDRLKSIFLGGFSLGGNICLKLAGELGDAAPEELRGVCAVSPSLDLASCADAIERQTNWFYQRMFLSSLKKRMRRVKQLYPTVYDLENLDKVRTVREFDSHFTTVHGGFQDVNDYYARASAIHLVENIRVPTLIIHAQDDPFIPFGSFRHPSLNENPAVTLLAPQHGGHVGFVSAIKTGEDEFWAENRLVEFCQLLGQK